MTGFKYRRQGSEDHDNMGDPANENTDTNGFISTKPGVRYPTSEDRHRISQKGKEQSQRRGSLEALTQGTRRFLCASRRCSCTVASIWKWKFDEIGKDLRTTIVRSTFGKLDDAKDISNWRHMACDFSQGRFFFFRRLTVFVLRNVLRCYEDGSFSFRCDWFFLIRSDSEHVRDEVVCAGGYKER